MRCLGPDLKFHWAYNQADNSDNNNSPNANAKVPPCSCVGMMCCVSGCVCVCVCVFIPIIDLHWFDDKLCLRHHHLFFIFLLTLHIHILII